MAYLTGRSKVTKLTLAAIMVYFSSYITRINYGAIISEFITAESVAKTSAAVITTVAFVTYGAGQIISGILGDRFNPRYLIFSGSLITVVMNVVMSVVSPNILLMSIVWGINGFAQAFMWPPLVKIMMLCLSPDDYDKSVIKIAYGSAGGTIAVYLLSPPVINTLGYRYVFVFSALLSLVFSFVWLVVSGKLTSGINLKQSRAKSAGSTAKKAGSDIVFKFLPLIMLSIIVQGVLRDGISTWFPNYISEVFGLPNTKSILIAVVLPLFHLACSLLTYRVLKLHKGNVFACLTTFFMTVVFLTVGLKLCGNSYIVVSVIMFALINGLAHSINVLQTEFIPKFFKSSGKISTFAGVLNACTYIGSGISTYAFAFISKNYGWSATLTSWVIFALSGAAVTCVMISFGKKVNEELI